MCKLCDWVSPSWRDRYHFVQMVPFSAIPHTATYHPVSDRNTTHHDSGVWPSCKFILSLICHSLSLVIPLHLILSLFLSPSAICLSLSHSLTPSWCHSTLTFLFRSCFVEGQEESSFLRQPCLFPFYILTPDVGGGPSALT